MQKRATADKRTCYIGDFAKGRANNFDFLRFFAAFLVICAHSVSLSVGDGVAAARDPVAVWTRGQVALGPLAVRVFFIMSGFLIAASYERSADLGRFAKARVLRIFPGLIAVVLVTAFVFGPLVTSLPLRNYLSSSATYAYLANATTAGWLMGHDALPGVFVNNATPIHVNGSLWTLFYEILCYCVVAVLGVTRLLKKPVAVILLLLALSRHAPDDWWQLEQFRVLFAHFAGGMCLYLFRNHIPMKGRYVLVALALIVLANAHMQFNRAFSTLGAYVVLFLALTPALKLNNFARRGDISYGIYIYAYPIQQSIVHFFGGQMNPLLHFIIALPLTLLFAALSWSLVEKRFMRMKPKVVSTAPA